MNRRLDGERSPGTGPRASVPGAALLGLALAFLGCDGTLTGPSAAGPGGGPATVGTQTPGGSDGGTTTGGGGSDGGTTSGGGSDGGAVLSSELPCEAYDVLSVHCWSCHGTTPSGGAPQSLATLAELRAASPSDSTQTNGARSVVRMQSTSSPMPPAPSAAVPAADATAFAAWVSAGMAQGTCVSSGGGTSPDGGVVDAGPPPPPDPLGAAPTCTSNTFWTGGTRKSPDMEPGHACITCHTQQGGPSFTVAGTVFPTGHEPDDCNGRAAGGAVVTVTDSRGTKATFTASSVSGNFHGTASLSFPITATVTFNGKTRSMGTAVSTGDCNSCHTQTGASNAPGRITLPP